MRKRVLIADDHAIITEGVAKLLASEYEVVGEVTNGRDLVAEAKTLRPDIIVLDVAMPNLNGIEAARQIRNALPTMTIIFLTQQLEGTYLHAAFEAGANGYVAKQSASKELIEAIRRALKGYYYVTPLAASKMPDLFVHRDPKANPGHLFGGKLTPRQREVLQLVAEGKAAKEIAAVLEISVKTVDFHKGTIMDVLGLRTTAELTRYALSIGIVSSV